jgi:MarR family transcriptional regulator, temperature-dependent positive regulator of motility
MVHMTSSHPEKIPFGAMISITARGHSVFLNDRLRPLGLTAGQFPVLKLLYREQNIIQETLVRHYRLDKGTIARAVRKLEDAGYIRRIVDPANRRAVRLFLTERGEQAAPQIHAIGLAWEAQISAGLSDSERAALQGLMRTVTRNSFSIMQHPGGPDRDGS